MPIPSDGHPAKCVKCGGKMLAQFNVLRTRAINPDGTLGDWVGGDSYDLFGYECEDCDYSLDQDGDPVE